MTYRIVWRRIAFEAMDAAVRRQPELVPGIAEALKAITDELRESPESTGESRDAPYRVQCVAPVTLFFRPAPDERVVYVTRARVFVKRSR